MLWLLAPAKVSLNLILSCCSISLAVLSNSDCISCITLSTKNSVTCISVMPVLSAKSCIKDLSCLSLASSDLVNCWAIGFIKDLCLSINVV